MYGTGFGRIRPSRLNTSRRSAIAPCDNRFGIFRPFVENLLCRTSGYRAIARIAQRYGSLDDHDIFSLIRQHGLLADSFRLKTACRHQRIGIIERNHFQQNLSDQRMRSSQKGFAATRTLLKVIPKHGFTGFTLQSRNHLRHPAFLQTEQYAHHTAKLQELTAAISFGQQLFVKCHFFFHGLSCLND